MNDSAQPMSTYLCPKGHDSTEADYCSECGTRIQADSVQPLLNPDLSAALSKTSESVICPDCAAPHEQDSGDFCEICGYNFVTGAHGEVPIVISHPPVAEPVKSDDRQPQHQTQEPLESAFTSQQPDPVPLTWKITITIDPIAHDAASPPPPNQFTPITLPLDRPTNLIGRTSQVRAIYPDISLDFDDAISHRHALLNLNSDGTLTLRDIGSSNGTKLNNIELKPMTDVPLSDKDEITLGHWTRIQFTNH